MYIKDNSDVLFKLAFKIENYIKFNKFDEEGTQNNQKKLNLIYYIVSAYWLSSFLSFTKVFSQIEDNDKKEQIFDRKFVLKQYFHSCFNNQDEDNFGCYPGPINNFLLIDFKKTFLNDNPINLETTNNNILFQTNADEFVFVKDGLQERIDFFLLPDSLYTELKAFFSSIYDIPRFERNISSVSQINLLNPEGEDVQMNNKGISEDDTKGEEKTIELSLKRYKVMVFSNGPERAFLVNIASPKYLQFSKSRTFGDLKRKLAVKIQEEIKKTLKEDNKKELLSCFQEDFDLKLEDLARRMKIFRLEVTTKSEKKNECFKLLLSYNSGLQSYLFDGDYIGINDNDLIEVILRKHFITYI